MYNLTGKVALVTGAASKRGFGRTIANRLATEGADVIITSRSTVSSHDEDCTRDWKGLDSLVEEIQALGRRTLAITCDITKSDQVNRMVKEAIEKFGQIDILVNNAGVHLFGKIENVTDEIWNTCIAINLSGTFFCSRAVAREMIKRNNGGRIINISSIAGKQGVGFGDSAYCASKFGVTGLTQSLALELATYGIVVNAVCPTLADTDIGIDRHKKQSQSEGVSLQEVKDRLFNSKIQSIPLGRLTNGNDIAKAVAFLASEEANFITGQSINVSGGELTAL
ncbi:SDR family NAD(P)-dependent oxidoreductase [Chloroflexota bacterium]